MTVRKMRKILISTLTPLGGNYGGALQAYALQKVLRGMGHEVTTDNMVKPVRTLRKQVGNVKRFVNMKIARKAPDHIDVSGSPDFAVYTRSFVERTMQTIDLRTGKRRPDAEVVKQYDTFVVGSDQVWRANYTDVSFQLFDYVLDEAVVRFSYAASFGKDDSVGYDARLIKTTASLAKKFRGISVREDSGVGLASELWGVEAQHHIDPTLLLAAKEYENLVMTSSKEVAQSPGDFFVYVLDMSERSKAIVNKVANGLSMKSFELLPEKFLSKKALKAHPEKYALPPVEQWLKSFIDAKFVVTDSFHGTVFAIIFNKPFIAIGNKSRGLARFESLLRMFGLVDRLVSTAAEVTDELLNSKIDWHAVEKRKEVERRRSYDYLTKQLS